MYWGKSHVTVGILLFSLRFSLSLCSFNVSLWRLSPFDSAVLCDPFFSRRWQWLFGIYLTGPPIYHLKSCLVIWHSKGDMQHTLVINCSDNYGNPIVTENSYIFFFHNDKNNNVGILRIKYYFPGFFILYWEMTAHLTPLEFRQVEQRPPTSLEKCTFTKNNYQSKEQGHLAWCNSFHLLSDLATFTVSFWFLLLSGSSPRRDSWMHEWLIVSMT